MRPAHKSAYFIVMILLLVGVVYAQLNTWLPERSRAAVASQGDFYVSPSGNDSNLGTVDAPFATLSRARDAARTKIAGMTKDIVIIIRGGTYTMTGPLVLTAQDSGQNGFNVVYQAYPGEQPVISGGEQVTGWQISDQAKNIWKASVGNIQTRQLYVNGARATRARGPQNPSGFTQNGNGFSTSDSSIASYRNLTDVEVVGYNDWRDFHCKIASVSGGNINLVNPCWSKSQTSVSGWPFNKVAYIDNAYELLDTPGEWYLDKPQGTLYYMPRSGENMSSAEVIVPAAERLIDGQGSAASPLHNIQFYGLSFAYAGWNKPSDNDGYVPIQTGYIIQSGGDGLVPGNLHFTGAQNLRFEHNLFIHLGAVGLNLERGSQNNTIIGNRLEDISNQGISIGNVDDSGAQGSSQNTNNTVSNNYITLVGQDYYDGAGVFGGYNDSLKITHNEITDIPYSPVALGWGWGASSYAKNNNVSYNYFHEFTKVLRDSAGVYTLSPQQGTSVTYNYIDHGWNDFGCLYPDEGSAYITWQHNVCTRVNQWLHLWTSSIHDNNIQFNYLDTSTLVNNNPAGNTVANNTVITNRQWPAEAQTIMNNAGIEANYQYVKTLALPSSSAGTTPVPTGGSCSAIPGDANHDGKVTLTDFEVWRRAFVGQ